MCIAARREHAVAHTRCAAASRGLHPLTRQSPLFSADVCAARAPAAHSADAPAAKKAKPATDAAASGCVLLRVRCGAHSC
jgi:hypothetical protein